MDAGEPPIDVARPGRKGEASDRLEEFLEAGVQHVIVGCGQPFDLQPIQKLLSQARAG